MATPMAVKKQSLNVGDFISDTEDEEIMRNMNRRGSNVSLSRFRSCPQLLDEEGKISDQAFESIADDSMRTNQNSRRSPLLMRRFQLEQAGTTPGSVTPTPPSTPRSRRSFFSQKESPSTPNQGLSPSSTPRLLRRNHVFPSTSSRDSSFESNKSEDHKVHVPLSEENLQKHEVLVNDVSKVKSKVKVDGQRKEGHQKDLLTSKISQCHQQGDDLHNKCEMWVTDT